MNELHRLHVIIEGIVQGVGFRYFVQETALEINLSGWVRNRWDGSVELVAEGKRADLERLLSLLYRGPQGADVRGVSPEWLPATGEFRGFTIKLTSN
jgi:acylphosphatase